MDEKTSTKSRVPLSLRPSRRSPSPSLQSSRPSPSPSLQSSRPSPSPSPLSPPTRTRRPSPASPVAAPASNPYQQAYAGDSARPGPLSPPSPPSLPTRTRRRLPSRPRRRAGPGSALRPASDGSAHAPLRTASTDGNGKATGALVCGIAAIVLCGLPLLSVVLGIAAIVLAGSYIKSGGVAGTAKAGRICGIVGIVLAVLMFVVSMFFGMAVFNEVMNEIDSPAASVSSSSSNSAPSSSLTTPSASRAYPEGGTMTDDERVACDVVGAEMEKLRNADLAVVSSIAALIDEGLLRGV